MLATVYGLQELTFLPGLVQSSSLRDLRALAAYLRRRVMARRRRGLYQAYVPANGALPYVWPDAPAGAPALAPGSGAHRGSCSTTWAENQLLALTLQHIARSGLCQEEVQTAVRRAFHGLNGVTPVGPAVEAGWRYHRLNVDYAPLHALCHFFLTHTGPGHDTGDRLMLPFLVYMPRLFEQFVARWLQQHLPPPLELRVQEQVGVGETGGALSFTLDMVLYDGSGRAQMVLDTKYKTEVAAADIHQIVTYAELRRCREAVLVYPQRLGTPLDVQIGDVRVRTLTFGLEGEPESEGRALLAALGLGEGNTISNYPL